MSMKPSYGTIERPALNPVGRLGSLYDACRDRVIEQNNLNAQEQWFQLSDPPQCKLISGADNASSNVLEWIGIQDELRLSLLLGLTSRFGIAAVMDYSHCIDQSTHFLHYSWTGSERVLEKTPQIEKISKLWDLHINATHVITGVRFGIEVLVVIQVSPNANIDDEIHSILKKTRDILLNANDNISYLTSAQNDLLDKFLDITVYSNIPVLADIHKISDLLHYIKLIKVTARSRYPVTYILNLITSLYPVDMRKMTIFQALPSALIDDIEHHMLQIRNKLKYVESSLTENLSKLLSHRPQHILDEVLIQSSHVRYQYTSEIQQFSKLIVDTRSEPTSICTIYQALCSVQQSELNESINELIKSFKAIKTNDPSITNPGQRDSKYFKVTEHQVDQSHDTHTIELKTVSNDLRDRSIDSSNSSDENNPMKFPNERQTSIEKDKNDPIISLSNVNISISPFQPTNMTMSSRDEINHSGNHSQQEASSSNHVSLISVPVSTSPSITKDSINILLLGETGVGKSTFINAFANYLVFKSLDQAQANEPIVIIPVSFIITVGDHFEERTIKFGEIDSLNNENFNNVGQSVTQHCKSYVFDPHQFNGTKLRIIDTPGFGDTRGLEQDDQNMEHILQYIHNLTHLNAICFLLKPNSSRLNMFFRTCLTQLFSFLAPAARGNVIFCFTNGRSTFYTPGDTAPLLRTMLASSSMNDIPFGKENVFCFDSESFRYLVALRNRITFTEDDKHEYETSWSTSVKESDRLIHYIDTNLTPYHIDNAWESIKHAEFEISHMIRPMLEAIRNFLRNLILCDKNLLNQFIELHPKALHRIATRCRSCKPDPRQVGQFWIISDLPHEIQTDFSACSCTPDQRVPIDYTLEHELSNKSSAYDPQQLTDVLKELCETCAKFGYFLMHVVCSTKDDPFLTGLVEMIKEESDICQSQQLIDFNKQLVEELEKFKNCYEQIRNQMKSDQESMKLPAIYKLIKIISEDSLVHKQMAAVRKTQQNMMAEYQYEPQKI